MIKKRAEKGFDESSHGGLVVEIVLGDAMVPGSIPGVVAETNIVSCVDDFQSTKLSWKTKVSRVVAKPVITYAV